MRQRGLDRYIGEGAVHGGRVPWKSRCLDVLGRLAVVAVLLTVFSGCATCPLCGAPRTPAVPPSPATPERPAPTIVRGVVTYLERIAMHPSATVEVRLWDLTQHPDTPTLVTQQSIPRPGPVPVAFELSVPTESLQATHEYSLTARILIEDTVLFATDTVYRVLTKDSPETVQLVLARVTADGAAP